jgi:hypothetical protein
MIEAAWKWMKLQKTGCDAPQEKTQEWIQQIESHNTHLCTVYHITYD